LKNIKKLLGLVLTVSLLFSMVSFDFTGAVTGQAVVPERSGVTLAERPVIQVSATRVARVGAGAGSQLAGNALVKATPSGIPDLGTSAYAYAAYAGETPEWPKVSITFPEDLVPDPTPWISVAATTPGGSVSMSSFSVLGNTYTAQIVGGTAVAGNTIKYIINYYISGTLYETYAYSYVEGVALPAGIQYGLRAYELPASGTGARVYYNYRLLGENVYSTDTGSTKLGYFDFVTNSFVANPSAPYKTQLQAEKDGLNGDTYNIAFKADANRPQATVYMDTSVHSKLSDMNLRLPFYMTRSTEGKTANIQLAATYVQTGYVDSVSSETTQTPPVNNLEAVGELGIAGTGGLMTNPGDMMTATFNGPGPAVSGSVYTVTMRTYAPRASGNKDVVSHTSVTMTVHKYDKGALRQKLDDIMSGAAGKGSNPQSWYFLTGWEHFKAIYDYANGILVKTKTTQAEIDSALMYLNAAYDDLLVENITYTVYSYIEGTVTELLPPVTETGIYSGYLLTATAEPITGYTLTDPSSSPKRIVLNSQNKTIIFYYTPNPYTIIFESNGGSAVPQITAGYDTPVEQPEFPVWAGHTFEGWYRDADLTVPAVWPLYMPLNGTVLYARWEIIPFTIRFNSNNGSPVAPISVPPGSYIQKPQDPTRTYFTFEGWFHDISFADPVEWPLQINEDNMVVYAKWLVIQQTVFFETNGGSSIPPITVEPNTAVYAPDQPTRSGYEFLGWYYDNNTFTQPVNWPIVIVNEGYTVYAKWAPLLKTITFDTQGGSEIPPLTAPVDSPISAPEPPKRFGYIFDGWFYNGEPYVFTTMPSYNLLLTAEWTLAPVSSRVRLDVYKTEDGELVPATMAKAGDIISVDLAVKTNFYTGSTRFIIMYDTDFYQIIGTNRAAITPNPGNPYYANAISSYGGTTASPETEWPETFVDGESSRYKFVAANFTASAQAANQGYPLIIDDNYSLFRIRLQVKATATGSGRIFMDSRWDRTSSYPAGGQYYFYCPDALTRSAEGESIPASVYGEAYEPNTDYSAADKTVELDTSVPVYSTISFDTQGGSQIAPITGEAGKAAVPPPNPTKVGHTFNGWTPAFPLTYPVSNITLRATWKVNTYNAIFMVDDGVYATIPVPYGSLIQAPANPTKTGYTFTGWSPSVGIMGAEDKIFAATFQPNNYLATFLVDGVLYSQTPVPCGEQIPLPTPPSKSGFLFLGWNPTPDVMPAENATFNAVFSDEIIELIPKLGSKTVIDKSKGLIYGLQAGISAETFETDFVAVNGPGELRITPYADAFGTGTKVELLFSSTKEVIETYYIVIFGDINGDGLITESDKDSMKNAVSFGLSPDLPPAFLFAADLTQDGTADAFDFNLFKASLAGLGTIDQNNPGVLK
jgi:uncharacterized repeat protein (TIGR02543 family)